MAYSPRANDTLYIDGTVYSIAEHPAAPEMPYGQEGRAATVYRVVAEETGELRALKVFKPRYQIPALVSLGERLEAFAGMQGLSVCRRQVITARRNIELVRQHPGLSYSVMMPWVGGPTWMETLLEGRELSPQESLALARSLTEILGGMEERGVAHCDLSGPNVLLPALADDGGRTTDEGARNTGYEIGSPIELVDVEQMYGDDLKRPEFVPAGSAGYAHKTASEGLWNARADRFAGALLIAEMLGWCDERVRRASWGESYFDPQEMQEEGSERYLLLHNALRDRWGEGVARLLEQAWESDTLADCATFGQWHAAIPDQAPALQTPTEPVKPTTPTPTPAPSVQPQAAPSPARAQEDGGLPRYIREMLDEARRAEKSGNIGGALGAYREVLSMAPGGSGLAQELPLIISQLEGSQQGTPIGEQNEEGERAIAAPPVAPPASPASEPASPATSQPVARAVVEPIALTTPPDITEPVSTQPYSVGETQVTPVVQVEHKPVVKQGSWVGGGLKLVVPIILGVALLVFGGIALLMLQPQSRIVVGNTVVATATTVTQADIPSVTPQEEPTVAVGNAIDATSTTVTQADVPSVTPQQELTPQLQPTAVATNPTVEVQNLSASAFLTLTGHTDKITGLSFSPDGQVVAAGSTDKTVRLWVAESGEELLTIDNGVPVYCLDFSPDGQTVATGSVDGSVKVWTISDLIYTTSESAFSISSIAFSPGGDLIAVGRIGGQIELLQASDGVELRALISGQKGYVNSLVFSADGQHLFSASSSEVMNVWDVANGTMINITSAPAIITRLALSRDGQRIALGLANGSIEIRNVAANELERTLTGPPGNVRSIAFSPDGGTLAAGSVDTPVTLWRVADGTQVQSLIGHTGNVDQLEFSSDGQFLASGSEDKTVRLWKLTHSPTSKQPDFMQAITSRLEK